MKIRVMHVELNTVRRLERSKMVEVVRGGVGSALGRIKDFVLVECY